MEKFDGCMQHLLLVLCRAYDVLAETFPEAAHRDDVSPLQSHQCEKDSVVDEIRSVESHPAVAEESDSSQSKKPRGQCGNVLM